MAILIVEHNGTLEGASLSGRILIGRRASNHVVIDHPAVSRIHAWIDTADRQFCITDAGSRTGTFVNGLRVEGGKLPLHHGDRITVGPASLIFRTDASLPAGVSQLNFGDRAAGESGGTTSRNNPPDAKANGRGLANRVDSAAANISTPSPASPARDDGILFECAGCHAPLWVSAAFAGRLGKCRFCGASVQVPQRPGVVGTDGFVMTAAPPASGPATSPKPYSPSPQANPTVPSPPSTGPAGAVPAAPAEACGACQSPIAPGESSTTCPACGLTFHADCWAENYGCSAYGCSQVNALLPKGEAVAPGNSVEREGADLDPSVTAQTTHEAASSDDAENAPKVTVEYALLAGSVVGVVLGALTFGVPALLACAAALVYISRLRRRGMRRTPRVVLAAGLLAFAGAVAGAAVSYVWWVGGTGDGNAALPLITTGPETPGRRSAQP